MFSHHVMVALNIRIFSLTKRKLITLSLIILSRETLKLVVSSKITYKTHTHTHPLFPRKNEKKTIFHKFSISSIVSSLYTFVCIHKYCIVFPPSTHIPPLDWYRAKYACVPITVIKFITIINLNFNKTYLFWWTYEKQEGKDIGKRGIWESVENFFNDIHISSTAQELANIQQIERYEERMRDNYIQLEELQIQTWYLKVLVKGELFPFRALFAIAVVVIILLCNSSLVCDAQGAAFLEIIIIESFSVASPRELMTIENWDVWEWQTKMPAVLNENETKLLQ